MSLLSNPTKTGDAHLGTFTNRECSFSDEENISQKDKNIVHLFSEKNHELVLSYQFIQKPGKVTFFNSADFFEGHNPRAFRLDKVYSIFAATRPTIRNAKGAVLYYKEWEVDGEFTGYFSDQYGPSYIPKGHAPNPDPQLLDDHIVDIVGGSFANEKEISVKNGTAIWKIPVLIMGENKEVKLKTTVIQKYEVKGKTFTITKGGCLLAKIDLQ